LSENFLKIGTKNSSPQEGEIESIPEKST